MPDFSHPELKIVFRNPDPKHEAREQTNWTLQTQDHDFHIIIAFAGNRPRVLNKRAA
jgi:hypothetical protein